MLIDAGWEEALESLLERVSPLPAESVPLMRAVGRVAARDIFAPRDLPSRPGSAVDGFAVRGDDLGKRTVFTVKEFLRNGDLPAFPLQPGEATYVVTGGPLPEGAEAVIPQESIVIEGNRLVFTGEIAPGANIRRAGEDFRAGELLVGRGSPVGPGAVGALAAFGQSAVQVYRRPKVAILSLGREIVPLEAGPPAPGQVRDSNGPLLASLVAVDGGEVTGVEVAGGESRAEIRAHLDRLLKRADLLLTVGGTAEGVEDRAYRALREAGATLLFRGVGIKPGSHSGAAVKGEKFVVFLSGNPAACAVGYQLFAAPVLRALQALPPYPPRLDARCAGSFPKKGGPRRFLRGWAEYRQDGWVVDLPPGQKASMLRSLVNWNALVDLAPGHPPLVPGARVPILLLGLPSAPGERGVGR